MNFDWCVPKKIPREGRTSRVSSRAQPAGLVGPRQERGRPRERQRRVARRGEDLPSDRDWWSGDRLAYLVARLQYIGPGDLGLCSRLMWDWIDLGLITRDDFIAWCNYLDSE